MHPLPLRVAWNYEAGGGLADFLPDMNAATRDHPWGLAAMKSQRVKI
jgi:hypothetical protein